MDKLKPWEPCRVFCSACSRQKRHLGDFLVTSYGRKWQLELSLGPWAPQSLSLPNYWCSQVQNLTPTLMIQYPWRCRYWSRCDLWIMPVKDTSMGSATASSFLICLFHELNETLWNIFFVPFSSLFFPCMGDVVGCPSFAGRQPGSWRQLPVLLSCWELWHTVSFLPDGDSLLVFILLLLLRNEMKVAGSSLLHTGKYNS